MALSHEDYIAILRHLQSEVRRIDPELHSLIVEHVEPSDNTRRYLLDYLAVLARVMAERSGGSHGRVLNLLNQSVRTEDGGPVRGLRLELTLTERETQQREYVDLAELPDRTEIVEALKYLRDQIESDQEEGGNQT